MRHITFTPNAFEDFTGWAKQDKKIYRKIVSLINDALRQPFSGLGKPEALKHDLNAGQDELQMNID